MYNQGHAETQDDIVYRQIRHCVRAFILHGECLGPFAEIIICDYQDGPRCNGDHLELGRRRPKYPSLYDPNDDWSEYFPMDDGVPSEISS